MPQTMSVRPWFYAGNGGGGGATPPPPRGRRGEPPPPPGTYPGTVERRGGPTPRNPGGGAPPTRVAERHRPPRGSGNSRAKAWGSGKPGPHPARGLPGARPGPRGSGGAPRRSGG